MKPILELSGNNFDEQTGAAGIPVVVDFYARWCGPCKMLSPLLDTLAGRFEGRVRFFKVNVEDAPELAARFDITGVPTLLLFKNGQPVGRLIGLASPRDLMNKLESLAGTNAEAHA